MTAKARISELKNRRSYYFGRVRRGESILVSDPDRVIARIEPAGSAPSQRTNASDWLDDLERRGAVRRSKGTLPRKWLAGRHKVKADVVGARQDERDESR